MLADMRAGVIKVLVIWHSDRIERRPGKALLDLLEEGSQAWWLGRERAGADARSAGLRLADHHVHRRPCQP